MADLLLMAIGDWRSPLAMGKCSCQCAGPARQCKVAQWEKTGSSGDMNGNPHSRNRDVFTLASAFNNVPSVPSAGAGTTDTGKSHLGTRAGTRQSLSLGRLRLGFYRGVLLGATPSCWSSAPSSPLPCAVTEVKE